MIPHNSVPSHFQKDNFPKLPCPRCAHGHVHLDPATLSIEEPAYSVQGRNSEDWEPAWDIGRFSARLKCDKPECGELVLMTGDTELVEFYDETDGGMLMEARLRPQTLFPGVPLITIPKDTPWDVDIEITKAFALFWSDLDAAANRVRVAIERMLDHLGVATTGIDKKGKTIDLTLNGRIDLFSQSNPEFKDYLHGFRLMGNLGSHGSGVNRQTFLDALELLEEALQELIGKRKRRLADMSKKLVASRGKSTK